MNWAQEAVWLVATWLCTLQPVSSHPALVTNYWPFEPDGSLMTAWGGQCNEDCETMANGTKVSPELEWKSGACPSRWVRITDPLSIYLEDFDRTIQCNDAFGLEYWRGPFRHKVLDMCVIGVDVMTQDHVFELTSWQLVYND